MSGECGGDDVDEGNARGDSARDAGSDCAPSLLDAAGLGSAVVGSVDARVADALSRLAGVVDELAELEVSQLSDAGVVVAAQVAERLARRTLRR